MGLMSDAAAWLNDTLSESEGEVVTYIRGKHRSAPEYTVTALRGQSEYEAVNEDGLTTVVRTHDFMLSAEAFTDATGLAEPKEGDRIVVPAPLGMPPVTYRVSHFRFGSHDGTRLRIHTTKIS